MAFLVALQKPNALIKESLKEKDATSEITLKHARDPPEPPPRPPPREPPYPPLPPPVDGLGHSRDMCPSWLHC